MPTAPGPVATALFALALLVPLGLALLGVLYVIVHIVRLAFAPKPHGRP